MRKTMIVLTAATLACGSGSIGSTAGGAAGGAGGLTASDASVGTTGGGSARDASVTDPHPLGDADTSNPIVDAAPIIDVTPIAPPACAKAAPAAMFALSSSSADVNSSGPYIVLTGTLPATIDGSPIASVTVGGSARGVRVDVARGVWSYLLAIPASADLMISARSAAGTTAGPLLAHVTLPVSEPPTRDLVVGHRMVGTWMFSWFTGDMSWRCVSAWQPPGGFGTWTGTAAWARDQLIDQIDAHLDAVGLQLDTPTGTGTQGYRFNNVVHVVEAARGLLEEGVLPPRLFPFVDTVIVGQHWTTSQGTTLDISTTAGRTYLYQHAQAFYQSAATALGSTFNASGTARFDGHPAIGLWHSGAMVGEDNAAVLDLKARFRADFGADPYLIAHPNDWRNFSAVDEITQMVGPPTHFLMTGHDASGAPTINLEAGFWNPISNAFYLPRVGGNNFDTAWMSAQAQRTRARHIWIDTWNETGEGSGIFAAQPLSYAAADTGPCGQFVNRHDETWGTDGRHYINVTRTQASAWNDAAELDAVPLASDAPVTMGVGERRWITVVMQNSGDRGWTTGGPLLDLTAASRADGFHIELPVAPTADTLTTRLGGVARGLPGVFTMLVTAPCTAGQHALSMQMTDPVTGPFGTAFSADVATTP